MVREEFTITSKVEIFPQQGGWVYVRVPEVFTQMSKGYTNRGLVPIIARVGATSWKTSLLPMGDGTHFIALNQKVRKFENINLEQEIEISFKFDI